jgi:hypothetical protein
VWNYRHIVLCLTCFSNKDSLTFPGLASNHDLSVSTSYKARNAGVYHHTCPNIALLIYVLYSQPSLAVDFFHSQTASYLWTFYSVLLLTKNCSIGREEVDTKKGLKLLFVTYCNYVLMNKMLNWSII